MAIFGFIVACLLGLYLIVAGIGGWFGMGALGGSFKKSAGFLIFAVIGALIWWWAYNNSPFHITIGS